ncbi:MAG: serine/threonine-protein kinase [Kofleriaceae bacterium]
MTCPNDETLLAMVERSLPPGRFGEIEHHLDSCETCRKMVAALALGSRPTLDHEHVPFSGIDLVAGNIIANRYAVVKELGHGGMGTVYLANDRTLVREVALKLHRAGSGPGGDRLQREAIAMAQLAHPNVVNVFEIGQHDDRMFVAMEYVKGGTLRSWLAEAPRDWRAIVAMLVETGRGLAAAHAANLIHRDFKPENVLVGVDGRPRVGDFGLARSDGAPTKVDPDSLAVALTVTGGIAGTPAYMAPEQLAGETVDARCDQFAFAVVAWEALYGKRPWLGPTISTLFEAIERHELPKVSSQVPERVRRVVERGLSTKPADRYPDLAALLADLRGAATPRTKRNAAIAAATVAVLAGGGYAAAATVSSRHEAEACDAAAARVRGGWSGPAHAILASTFQAYGATAATSSFERTAATLDRYSDALSDAMVATCRDHDAPFKERQAKQACLVHLGMDLNHAVLALSMVKNRSIIAQGPQTAWSLFDPHPCSDASVRPNASYAPDDQAKLSELRADVHTAKFKDGLKVGQAFLADIRARKDKALELDALLLVAELETTIDPKQSIADLELAEQLAEAQGRDLEASEALDRIAQTSGTEIHDHALAHRQLGMAKAKLARIGGNTSIEARLAMTEAQVFADESKLADAEKAMTAAIPLFEKAYGAEHPYLASAWGALSQIYNAEGKRDEATAAAQKCVTIANDTLGQDHPTTAGAKLALAQALIDKEQFADAKKLLLEADATFAKIYGEVHVTRASVQGNLFNVDLAMKDYTAALADSTKAYDILVKAIGPNALYTAGPERDRSVALGALNRLPEADAAATHALQIIEAAGADGEQRLAGAISDLCEVQIAEAKPAACIPNAERAIEVIESHGAGADPLELADTRYVMARAMWDAKLDRPRALKLAAQAMAEHPVPDRKAIIAAWIKDHPLK